MKATILTGSLPDLLVRIWRHLTHRRRRQFGLLLGVMLVSAFAEVVSLGAVLPFLGILLAPEQSVMDAIEGLSTDLTILIVAHRLTTVERCDMTVELENGRVVAQGTYEQLLECSPSFRRMAAAI